MFFFLRFKEITPADQEQKCKTISEEHGKQIHLKESLKIEEQMKNFIKESEEEEKRISQEAEKVELQIRKAKRDLSVAKDESHLRGVVQDMFHNVSAGENSLQPVFLYIFIWSLISFLFSFACLRARGQTNSVPAFGLRRPALSAQRACLRARGQTNSVPMRTQPTELRACNKLWFISFIVSSLCWFFFFYYISATFCC